MEILTLDKFLKLERGKVFASGIVKDDNSGINMTNTGNDLRWIAKAGGGNDWAIYIHWAFRNEEWITKHGDKVTFESHIRKLIPCDIEVFNLYRF
jgi:hypothetical protein